MAKLNIKKVTQYVEEHIGDFHQKRFDKIRELRLKEILSAKNPY